MRGRVFEYYALLSLFLIAMFVAIIAGQLTYIVDALQIIAKGVK